MTALADEPHLRKNSFARQKSSLPGLLMVGADPIARQMSMGKITRQMITQTKTAACAFNWVDRICVEFHLKLKTINLKS